MSSGQAESSLRVVIQMTEKTTQQEYVRRTQHLGHNLLATYTTVEQLLDGLRELPQMPDIIVTDTTKGEPLQAISVAVDRRRVTVPLLVISNDVDTLVLKKLEWVLGVCLEPVSDKAFQVELELVISRREWRIEAAKNKLAISPLKRETQALTILFDFHHLKSMAVARRMLNYMTTTRRRSLALQIERIIAAGAELTPPPKKRKVRKEKRPKPN